MRFILMARVVLAVAFGPFLYHGRLLAKMTGQVCLFHLLTDDMFFFYFSKAWRNPQPKKIARLIAYAYTCGFLFGWHVHEKASLHFVIPLAIVSLDSMDDARHCFLLAAVSYYSLLPLLFEAQEYPLKVTLLLFHCILMWSRFSTFFLTQQVRVLMNILTKKMTIRDQMRASLFCLTTEGLILDGLRRIIKWVLLLMKYGVSFSILWFLGQTSLSTSAVGFYILLIRDTVLLDLPVSPSS